MTAHSIRGASSAHRWTQCAGSIRMSEDMPEQTSIFAAEGTLYHEQMEQMLLKGEVEHNPDVTAEMLEAVSQSLEYLDHCGLTADRCDHFGVEEQVSYSYWVKDGFGTSDVIAIKDGTMHIADFKYGQGVKVSAQDNLQLKLYALGAYYKYHKQYDIKDFELHIIQPRMVHFESAWVTHKELRDFAEWIKERAIATLDPDAPLSPSEAACRWCKAKATCPALHQHTQELIASDFDSMELPSPDSLTPKQLRQVLEGKKLVEGWLNAVEEYVTNELSAGREFLGYKLVEGRSIRKWKDGASDVLQTELGEDAFEKKLIGVTAAEKMLGKKRFNELGLTHKPMGKPVLAKSEDKRPALGSAVNDFDEIA